jgi:hypothetical protein
MRTRARSTVSDESKKKQTEHIKLNSRTFSGKLLQVLCDNEM